jgi:SPOR domain
MDPSPMMDDYYVDEADLEGSLDLVVLARLEPEARFYQRHDNLNGLNPDPHFSERLYNFVQTQQMSIWIVGLGTGGEELPVAIGIAGRTANSGAAPVLLVGPEEMRPPQMGEAGLRPVTPGVFETALSGLFPNGCGAQTSGVQGVFRAWPGQDLSASVLEPASLIIASSWPTESFRPAAEQVSAVIPVVPFRDQTAREIEERITELRTAGYPLLGMVTIDASNLVPNNIPAETVQEANDHVPFPAATAASVAGNVNDGGAMDGDAMGKEKELAKDPQQLDPDTPVSESEDAVQDEPTIIEEPDPADPVVDIEPVVVAPDSEGSPATEVIPEPEPAPEAVAVPESEPAPEAVAMPEPEPAPEPAAVASVVESEEPAGELSISDIIESGKQAESGASVEIGDYPAIDTASTAADVDQKTEPEMGQATITDEESGTPAEVRGSGGKMAKKVAVQKSSRPALWLIVALVVVVAAAAVITWRMQSYVASDEPETIAEVEALQAAETELPQQTPPAVATSPTGDQMTQAAPPVVDNEPAASATASGSKVTSEPAAVTKAPQGATGGETPSAAVASDGGIVDFKADNSGPYAVLCGSFGRLENAEREVTRLMELGEEARVVSLRIPEKGVYHRVIIGSESDRALTENLARRVLDQKLADKAMVVAADGIGIATMLPPAP